MSRGNKHTCMITNEKSCKKLRETCVYAKLILKDFGLVGSVIMYKYMPTLVFKSSRSNKVVSSMLRKLRKLIDTAERQIESENNYLAAGIAAFIGLMVIIGLMFLYYAKKKGKCKSCTKNEICTMIQEELV